MRILEATNEDGKRCIALIRLLSTGRWDLSAADAEELVKVRVWVGGLANELAGKLRASEATTAVAAPAEQAMRVKSMGPLPSTGGGGKRKKK
jgi:hypothetical protein